MLANIGECSWDRFRIILSFLVRSADCLRYPDLSAEDRRGRAMQDAVLYLDRRGTRRHPLRAEDEQLPVGLCRYRAVKG